MPVLHLKAKPNAQANQLSVAPDGTITVRLKAPAQDGKANACLLAYLAEVFGVTKANLTLVSGHTAPFKKVDVAGLTEETYRATLERYQGA
ncbi:DUF167 domain-containing protein [Hymenobacter taeanensis]|uniref:UPF0235 protein HMJ29_11075 n=1 Tax=Hymenobacter taeanensis TaxID=2735321 RepID=A0A6M6BFY8_9BACT|nr:MULTISPECIES: DUF167 domain-containing protein [Hymenobacter]QJX47451.1 DUF167 domain-containing protein [Hymenobacter taeanensis]UOQ83067.1 DUF167 domain-containing protein [Hymenobacter sp. 5414T-23]